MTSSRLPKVADYAVPGFTAGAVAADIKGKGTGAGSAQPRLDLALIHCPGGASVAGVFTRNRMAAAPVLLCRERLAGGSARAVLVNSGCANCMTGKQGRRDAELLSRELAALLHAPAARVFPASTGVIGARLPVERMRAALPALAASLSPGGMEPLSRAIMTTDTRPKAAAAAVALSGGPVRLLGVAKGSGMIAPHMATMLSFVLTDAAVPAPALQRLLKAAVAGTFNAVTIDGDTSTNDTLLLLASGAGPALRGPADRAAFAAGLRQVCLALAEELAADGEGATRVARVEVAGARSRAEAERVARAVGNSPLVKTALAAGDPNWGRIACAAGYAGVPFDPARFSLSIGEVAVVRRGEPVPGYDEAAAARVMAGERFTLRVSLGDGPGAFALLASDFTEEYVRINKDYRT